MGEFMRMFLPIIWLAIAAWIGLLLYRHSKALVQTKNARFTGAGAIAIAAFLALYKVTPSEWLHPVPPGSVIVKATRVQELRAAVQSQKTEVNEARRQCFGSEVNELRCSQAIDAIDGRASVLGGIVDAVEKDGMPTPSRSSDKTGQ